MKTVSAWFSDKDGRLLPGSIIVCDRCGGRFFLISKVYIDNKKHEHIECSNCHESYCDGTCGGVALSPESHATNN